MNTAENLILVMRSLEEVADRCRENRALVLTESDLKCQVYSSLLLHEEFNELTPTFDREIRGIAVHTETKFFNQRGLLKQAPDLVVTDPRRTSITQRLDGDPVPSKGFHFDGPSILIELKFLKRDGRPTSSTLDEVEKDILKGRTLNRRADLDFHLVVAVFDRFWHGQNAVQVLFNQHQLQENLTCVYFGGGDSFRQQIPQWRLSMRQQMDCFIFYFDIIGVVDTYLKDPSVIIRLENWQRDVRDKFNIGDSDTTCKTLFDNIWARITSRHPESDMYTVLDFAGTAMRLAKQHGFDNYFGAITYGLHEYDIFDRTLVAGGQPTDIIKQHIDTLGPAHIRAAFAEKWSATLYKKGKHPINNAIWVSEEALFGIKSLWEVSTYSNHHRTYSVPQLMIDLNDPTWNTGKPWPFVESKFQFITA